jgi:hypothetical protein
MLEDIFGSFRFEYFHKHRSIGQIDSKPKYYAVCGRRFLEQVRRSGSMGLGYKASFGAVIRGRAPGLMKVISFQPDGGEIFERGIVPNSDRTEVGMAIADRAINRVIVI